MAGADWLVARGIADPNRLGIGGWSYGGYMAAWAVTQTTRFKAAVSGAPVIDMASEFGTENGSAYDEWFYGTPYEKLDGFIKSSPMTFVKNAKTPTLLLQGEDDTTDPIGQSQQFYRGLKRYGVDVRPGPLSARAARAARGEAPDRSTDPHPRLVRHVSEAGALLRLAAALSANRGERWSG